MVSSSSTMTVLWVLDFTLAFAFAFTFALETLGFFSGGARRR